MGILNHTMLLAAVLGILVVLLIVCLILQLIRGHRLKRQLDCQLERVEVRKKKILQLRKVIGYLAAELQKSQSVVKSRPDQYEFRGHYDRIRDILLRIYRRCELNDLEEMKICNLEFSLLSEQLSAAFGAENDDTLPWLIHSEEENTDMPEKKNSPKRRALIVDDKRTTSSLLSRILSMNGYRTEIVEQGEQAVQRFLHSSNGYYSIIFMDMVLGGMSGCDVAREIRRSCRDDSNQIPIIAMMANDFAEDVLRMQEAGMNDRLLKPIDENSVQSVLKKWKNSTDLVLQPEENIPTEETVTEKMDETWKSLSPSENTAEDC